MTSISDYLALIGAAYSKGNATEHTHRPALKSLLESAEPGLIATNEPKRIACGAPDYIVTRGASTVGYVEAKDINSALDQVEKSPQLTRYLRSLSNLVLTDYLEFRWYELGELRLSARLADTSPTGHLQAKHGGDEELGQLLDAFIHATVPTISSPQDLAERMASLAKLINSIISKALENEPPSGALHQQMKGFKTVLLHELTQEMFADMYAQTIAYGLFAARVHTPTKTAFTRQNAAYDLPKTNPFLRQMFAYLAGPNLDARVEWAVDDLAELLRRTDMPTVLKHFGKLTGKRDPVIHFYETFLAAYNPKLREGRGVYYTPEPIVSYIVESIDYLLGDTFKLVNALATTDHVKVPAPGGGIKKLESITVPKVQILDPAAGTGTFLYEVINKIYDRIKATKQTGTWNAYVAQHLIPRVFGFELLMTPYTVAHLKLGLLLGELGYDFSSDERLRIYLTNTLDDFHAFSGLPLFAQWLAQEANAATSIKRDAPVMVILGNPPYSGHSKNTGKWITHLLHGREVDQQADTYDASLDYFSVDGQRLQERNPKWLYDDYVKFIRFAQWRIDRTGEGILGFITNHGFLDNPTFRGMRESLMTSFTSIYLLDLHGNTKKRERPPMGVVDKPVFDVQQGVSIGLFVKTRGSKAPASIYHADLWGTREYKYEWLSQNDVSSTTWTKVKPVTPFYLFVPQDPQVRKEYYSGWSIRDAMPLNVLGFQTHRDHFAISIERDAIIERIGDLRSPQDSDDALRDRYKLKDNRDWQLKEARSALRNAPDWRDKVARCLYRPFDWRFCYFDKSAMDYPRRELRDHVLGRDNLCLLLPRQTSTRDWRHSLVADTVAESCAISLKTKEQNYVFPLYVYPTDLFAATGSKRSPNFDPSFIQALEDRLHLKFAPVGPVSSTSAFRPDEVLSYIYALTYSSSYRERYASFLQRDFFRIQLTSDLQLFRHLGKLGARLVKLHLLQDIPALITAYPVAGTNTIDTIHYEAEFDGADSGRIRINKEQYFDDVPAEVWAFELGGHRVADKWLRDRKGMTLSFDDVNHYQVTLSVLAATMATMTAIDDAIEAGGGLPLQ